jgi:hypothetical protein
MTPSEAMQRFLEKMKPLMSGDLKSRYKSTDEVSEDCFSLIEPFVANPQRHKDALKMIVRRNWRAGDDGPASAIVESGAAILENGARGRFDTN